MSILSIQSHVTYGYVGNKAAVFPLQSMGYDVWPINTVQFSNHTGYGKWTGQLFSAQHIREIVDGIEQLGVTAQCQAILSGYLGAGEIGQCVLETVARFKQANADLVYLCDPVIGDVGRGIFVKPEVLDFFKCNLHADIITPNHFEAEILTGKNIETLADAKQAAAYFHERGIKIVVITSLRISSQPQDKITVFLSDQGESALAETPLYHFEVAPNGTGDLFSALFLGSYLKLKKSVPALHASLALMDVVMAETYRQKSRELKVLAVSRALL
ncbi:MAG: pyridoxal kinase PdxY [Legionellales bacterium]|nr:pyridoxal kinase PdxY [Legionellales bacterium]